MIRPDSRKLVISKTFNGAAGSGAVGTVALATLTGRVVLDEFVVICDLSLEGATATISLGSTNLVGGLIAATTATGIDTGFSWVDTGAVGTAEATRQGALPALVYGIAESLLYNILVQAITAGQLTLYLWWRPLTADGNLVAA